MIMTYKEPRNFGSGIHITGQTTVHANGHDTPYSFDIFQHSYDEVVLSLRNRLYQPDSASTLWQTFSVRKGPMLSVGKKTVSHPVGTASAFLSALSSSPDSSIEDTMVRNVLSKALSA